MLSINNFPKTIERICCRYKNCGTTTLTFHANENTNLITGLTEKKYSYLRDNNDVYFSADSLEELYEKLNDKTYWL